MPTDNKSGGDSGFRVELAKTVTAWALIAILAIAGLIIVVAALSALNQPSPEKMEKFFDISKYVLGVLLPVIGAWVGTVLAFYFGQGSFEAASRSAANLVHQKTTLKKVRTKYADQARTKSNQVTT